MYKDIMIKVGEGYKDIPLDKVQESLDSEDNSSSYKFFIVAALIEHIENLTLSIREFHNSLIQANLINKEQAEEINKLKEELNTYSKTIELIEGTLGRHKRILS